MTTEAAPSRPTQTNIGGVVVLVGLLGGIYSISQFLRNSVGVIAPDLAQELHLSASEIGFLSSAFFFSFAGAQIPLGIALDRYGPRRCMLFCAAIAIAGAIMFAAAASPAWLITSRVLMGLGSSCYLMAPLALYARNFPADRFASMVGFQIGVGNLGTLLATAPFAFAVALIGWRGSFLVIAVAMLLVTIAIALIVPRDEPVSSRPQTLREGLAGTLEAIRVPSFWPVFCLQLTTYSTFALVVGLWGGPYLTHVYGFSLTERGNMLLAAVVAQIVGSVLWGSSNRLCGSYKIPVLIGSVSAAALLMLIAFVGVLPPVGVFFWFIAIGLVTANLTVAIAHGKSLFPPALVGRGLTLFNMATMGGVFLTQALTGMVIDLFPQVGGGYSVDAYRAVFGFQAACILLGCLAYLRSRDPSRYP